MSAPDIKTEPLQIRGRPPSVKRFNRRILGGLLGTAALGLVLAAGFAFRSPESETDAPKELYNTTSKALPDGLNALPRTYGDVTLETSSYPPQLGPPLPGDIGAGFYAGGRTDKPIPDNPFRYQPPPRYDYAPVSGYGAGQAQGTQGASPRTSKLFFMTKDGGGDRRQAETSPSESAGDGGFEDPGLVALQTLFGEGGAFASAVAPGSSVETPDTLTAFTPAGADIYNPHGLQMPVSPYQVMAGTIIPASLVTGLNSDLPGQVIAQVIENVFDTPTGQHLLIPQGTRLLGQYDSEIDAGQSRALVVWNRMIRPDGSSLVIESLPSVDLSGQAGLRDRIDRHSRSLFGAALLSSVLSVASELGSDEENEIAEAIRDGGQSTIN